MVRGLRVTGSNFVRRGVESIAEFMERRAREVGALGRDAEAAAHAALGRAARSGGNFHLPTTGDVVAYGASLLNGQRPQAAARPVSQGVRPAPRPVTAPQSGRVQVRPLAPAVRPAPTGGILSELDRNPYAKSVGGALARDVGRVAGVVRGGAHLAEGLYDSAVFVNKLLDPLDNLKSAPGQSAGEKLFDVGRGVLDYTKGVVANPRKAMDDIGKYAHQVRVDLDPAASPVADTFSGELRRMHEIGKNQGELGFNVASAAVGAPEVIALSRLGTISKLASPAKYAAQGFSPAAAARLAEPYEGMGHHYIPRSHDIWKALGDGPLVSAIRDGPFNVSRPRRTSQGDFYQHHYEVDPNFSGTTAKGERWSGDALGFKKRGQLGQIIYGAPDVLQSTFGGAIGAVGGLTFEPLGKEDTW